MTTEASTTPTSTLAELASSGPVPEPVQPQAVLEELLKLQAREEEQANRIEQMEAEGRKEYRDVEGQIENLKRQRDGVEARRAEEISSRRVGLLRTTGQKNQYWQRLYNLYLQERSEAMQELLRQTGDEKLIKLVEWHQHSQELEKLLGERTDGYDVHLPPSDVYTLNRAIDNLLQMNCPFLTGKRDKQGVPHYVLNGKEVIIVAHTSRFAGVTWLTEEQNPWKYTQDVFRKDYSSSPQEDYYFSPRGTTAYLKLFYQEPGRSTGLECLGFMLQQEVAHLVREQELNEEIQRRRSDHGDD